MSYPTRVAFDARYVNDRYHGIGRHAVGLLEALTRLDAVRQYHVFYNPDLSQTRFDLTPIARRPNVRMHALRLPLLSPREQVAWPTVIARHGCSIFHSPYVTLPYLSPAALVMTVHDLIFERFPQYMPLRHLRLAYRAGMLAGTRRATAILAVSQATSRDLAAIYPGAGGKTVVVPNASDASFHRVEDPAALERVRQRYNLPARFVLTVGAGRPHKNVGRVVEAYARLDPATAPALVLAGEPDERFADEVGRLIHTLGLETRVHRLGSVAEGDLAALYTLAEVFAFPSLVEGFGLPILEAMACGTPVIASNVSSMPEVAGYAALLFDPLNVDEMARVLSEVLANPDRQAQLRARGYAQVQRFTWDAAAARVLQVYNRIDRNRARSRVSAPASPPGSPLVRTSPGRS